MSFSGSPIPLAEAVIRRLRGSTFPMIAAAARASAGRERWEEHLASLPPAARALLEAPPAPQVWLDAGLVAQCWTLLDRAGNLGSVPGALGAETIRIRNPQSFTSPSGMVKDLARFWRGSVEGGVVETELTGPHGAVVRMWALWAVPYFFEGHVPAWFTHGLYLAGGLGPEVRHTPPTHPEDFLHTYDLSWS